MPSRRWLRRLSTRIVAKSGAVGQNTLGSRLAESPINGGEVMPVYEYQCQGCRHQFTVVLTITEHDKLKVECPKCKSKKVEQRLSAFYAKTAKKS